MKTETMLVTGHQFNDKINKNAMYFRRAASLTTNNMNEVYNIGMSDHLPVWTWYEEVQVYNNESLLVQYWYSDADVVYMNPYSEEMFCGLGNLISIDLSRFNASKVVDISGMFHGCKSLIMLNVSNWDTSNVEHMSKAFCGCESLQILDLSGWSTSKVLGMSFMFCDCIRLETLNLSNFDMSMVQHTHRMFENVRPSSIAHPSKENTTVSSYQS